MSILSALKKKFETSGKNIEDAIKNIPDNANSELVLPFQKQVVVDDSKGIEYVSNVEFNPNYDTDDLFFTFRVNFDHRITSFENYAIGNFGSLGVRLKIESYDDWDEIGRAHV